MLSLKEQFIHMVVGEVVERAAASRAPRILDVGCGTAGYVPELLKAYPHIEYVGVEPIPSSFAAAEKNLAGIKNATVHFQLGYDTIPNEADASFDGVLSLSVLEHIKQLDRFIALSAKYLATSGLVVHRYDLGHALYPHSRKERLHVWLGNTVPSILPERQFVRYVPEYEVREYLTRHGVTPVKTTYHQMPNHKRLEKELTQSSTTAMAELFAWEMSHQSDWQQIPLPTRELLFPAVAVWGEKR